MIPFVELRSVDCFGLTLPVFGPLAVLGAGIGHWLLVRTLVREAIMEKRSAELFTMACIGSAVIGSWITGRSIGGIGLALVVSIAFCIGMKQPIGKTFDVSLAMFPVGLFFLRIGCSLIHDHVGVPTTHWLGVVFPEGRAFDLGVLELLALPGLLLFAWSLRSIRRVNGTIVAPGVSGTVTLAIYCALRFSIAFAAGDPPFASASISAVQWVFLCAGISSLLFAVMLQSRAMRTA